VLTRAATTPAHLQRKAVAINRGERVESDGHGFESEGTEASPPHAQNNTASGAGAQAALPPFVHKRKLRFRRQSKTVYALQRADNGLNEHLLRHLLAIHLPARCAAPTASSHAAWCNGAGYFLSIELP